jgi:hypothetical protein
MYILSKYKETKTKEKQAKPNEQQQQRIPLASMWRICSRRERTDVENPTNQKPVKRQP